MDKKLALVVAPAGYGKSTLVAEWLETCECLNAWLSLDENDSDLVIFLDYFIAAVQTVFAEIGQEVMALLQMTEQPPPRILAGSLINALNQIKQPFALALDDYHLVQDSAVHDLMDELLHYAPRMLHLVLISREMPPLNLRRLRAQGQLVEIRTEDLRFTIPETAAFVQKNERMWMGHDKVTLLQEKTEGWITGLRLSMLSLKQPEDIDHLANHLPGKQLAIDYLFQEVFANQPEAVRAHFLNTSILDRFSAPLCAYLRDGMGEDALGGQEFIDWLGQANVFAIALDDQQQWYRYHHLFRDVLRDQAAAIYDTERLSWLHTRASEWFAQNGFIDEAIRHALSAGDISSAARLVEQNRHDILNDDHWPILDRWLSYFPEQVIRQRVELLLTRLWVVHFFADISWMQALLNQLEPLLETDTIPPTVDGEINLFRGELMLWSNKIEKSIEYFERATALIPAEQRTACGVAELSLVVAYQMNGQLDKSMAKYWVLLEKEYDDNSYTGRLLAAYIFVYILSGQFVEAYRLTRRLQRMAKRMDHPYYLGWANYLLGYIYFGWNDLERAILYFSQAVENYVFLNRGTSVDAHIGLAVAYQWAGQPERSNAVMGNLLERVQDDQRFPIALQIRSARARLAMLQGDLSQARRLLRGVDFTLSEKAVYFAVEIPLVTYGRLLIALGTETSLSRGIEILRRYLESARYFHNTCRQVEVLPILSVAYQKQGDRTKAVAFLQSALTLAVRDGWIHPFLEPGAEIIGLLDEVDGDSAVRDFVARILNAFSTTHLPQHEAQQLMGLLTNRELEVLTLLSQRYSNKEIAAELFISPATVKRHTSNIYAKLEVHGRQQAVAKAVALGLISPRRSD
jgi:LuxR family maltose regulon positive regulatory protein